MSVVQENGSVDLPLTGNDETFGLRKSQRKLSCDLLAAGVDIGGAIILRELASGGMGQVFEARQHAPARRVAVKFLNGPGDKVARRLFEQEAALLARVKHANIADVYTVGVYERGGRRYHWIMMELVEDACSLTEYAARRHLSLIERVRLALDAVSAMTAAHAKGIIHLDIKSSNVLVGGNGIVKVIDFGIGRALTEKTILKGGPACRVRGTPASMSPEQRAGCDEFIDARSDIFGIGMLFAELFFQQSSKARRDSHVIGEINLEEQMLHCAGQHRVSRGAAKDLCSVIAQCTQQCPENRFSTMREVEQELTRWLKGHPVVCRQLGAVESACRWMVRNKSVSCFLVMFMLTVISSVSAISWFAYTASISQQRAVTAAEIARGTLADSLLRQAFSAEREHHSQMVRELLGQREDVLSSLAGRVPSRVVKNDSLAIRTLRSRLDDASAFWRSPGEPMTSVAVASGAGVAIASNKDGGVVLYSLSPGRLDWRQAFHYETGSRPWVVAISDTGRTAIVGCDDGLIHVLDTQDRKAIGVFSGHTGPVYGLVMLPSGKEFLSSGRDGRLCQWNVQDQSRSLLQTSFDTSVYGLAQSSDGIWIAAGLRDGSVRLWNKDTGREQLLTGHQDRVFGVDFSDDGKHLASASEDQTVRVWDLKNCTEHACFYHPVRVNAVRFCGAGKVASAAGDQLLRIWNVHGKKEVRILDGHEGPIWSLDTIGGTDLLTGSEDGTVRLWENAWDPQPSCVTDSKIHAVSMSADGRYLAAGNSSGSVTIWDAETRNLIGEKKVSELPVNEVCWHPALPELSVAGSDGTITQWAFERRQSASGGVSVGYRELRLWHMRTLLGHRRRVFSIAYSASGSMLASAGEDGTVRLWRRDKLKSELSIRHPGRVFCLAFSNGAEPERLATGCEDGILRVFDEQGEQVQAFRGHRGQINALSWNRGPGHRWNVASAGADGTVRLWQLSRQSGKSQSASRTPSAVLATGGTKIWSLASVPDEPLIIAGTQSGEVLLWSTFESMSLASFQGHDEPVWSVSVGPDGNQLWSGGWDGNVRRWDVSRAQSIQRANRSRN
ncbi:MAG: serine/threonine protein kinase [Pirellulales bacterium]|nr:serine/threonine protein kinase [Pirellulales bacterium]